MGMQSVGAQEMDMHYLSVHNVDIHTMDMHSMEVHGMDKPDTGVHTILLFFSSKIIFNAHSRKKRQFRIFL
jgi:hypothetical protein